MPIRVLWLSHVLPWPAKGGLQQRAYYLMRAIGSRHTMRLITFTQRTHQPTADSVAQGVAELSRFCHVSDVIPLPQDRSRHGQLRIAARSLLPGGPFTMRWGRCPQYAAAVRSAVREFSPDLVHFDTLSLANYLPDIQHTPAILNHHNIESHMLIRRASREGNLARRLYYLQEGYRLAHVERSVAQRFCRHLVCSDLDAERLIRSTGARHVDVVPNGVDLEYFRPAPEPATVEPDSLVFVGGLGWYPNADAIRFFLCEVWPLVKRSHPKCRFRIVGRGPPDDIKAIAAADPNVELLGFVDDIRPLVQRTCVYVCPIRDGGGTKLKMLDAMAMGKAIVAHPVACEGLQTVDGQHVLMADDPGIFAKRISELFSSSSARHQFGINARRHVEANFSFDRIGDDLSSIMASAAAQCVHP